MLPGWYREALECYITAHRDFRGTDIGLDVGDEEGVAWAWRLGRDSELQSEDRVRENVKMNPRQEWGNWHEWEKKKKEEEQEKVAGEKVAGGNIRLECSKMTHYEKLEKNTNAKSSDFEDIEKGNLFK